ncbi:hypothetical protein [Blastochloris sulfoviridis]|uniref:Uncharacterized protein n=1 Tax=Blastochloris sulfoviridis TaxID=50712 RepID=A0A5M6HK62_9HYPH|nr:hypothetical protein [Blastochloris sulfoviridis]KAA5596260.1 hypothetical protein F1193_15650 [Blastochloris sulfoviridis]
MHLEQGRTIVQLVEPHLAGLHRQLLVERLAEERMVTHAGAGRPHHLDRVLVAVDCGRHEVRRPHQRRQVHMVRHEDVLAGSARLR